jgi:hypothetical protein
MNPQNVWIVSTLVGTIGGVIAAFTAIYQMHAGRQQRIRELRWNQAKLAKEMLDKIEAAKEVASAFRLLDWDNYEHEIRPAQKVPISHDELWKALRVEDTLFTPKEAFIRDCFDVLFDRLGYLEHYVTSGLVIFQDVQCPFDYYIEKMARRKVVIQKFMQTYKYHRALAFCKRFPEWTATDPVSSAM